ncbi:MAG: hypothetical protein MJ009_05690 [Paludibacteraceae bacterium]|nr:hypothetical protein [Paludibacteraceae bacterium]
MEKQKLQKKLRQRLSWLLPAVMLFVALGYSTQEAQANFDSKGTYYFDNNVTNWSKVYFIIGRSDWSQAIEMSATDCDGIVSAVSTWDNTYEFFFADSNCGYTEGSGAGDDIASKRSGNYSSDVTSKPSKFMFVPSKASGTNISGTWSDVDFTPCQLPSVLAGSKIMFYIGEYASWGQETFYLSKNSSVVSTAPKVVEHDSKRYGVAVAPATTGYNVTHDKSLSYAGHPISGTPVQGGAYYNTDDANCQVTNSTALTASVTLASSSISAGSNVAITESSKSNGILGLTSQIKYYATTDNTTFTELSVSSSNLQTSGLAEGTWTIIPVFYDGHITCKGTTTTLTVAASGDAPTVLIADAPDVSGDIGTLYGYLKLTGCQDVTDYGFIWSETQSDIEGTNPTGGTTVKATYPTGDITVGNEGTEFKAEDKEFTPQTTIYYRAYATNTIGTSYSEEIRSFSTAGCIKPVVTDIDVPANICSNAGTITATATATAGSTFVWSVDGTVFTAASGTTATATITVGAAGTGSITVTPTKDACEGNSFTLSDITVKDATITAKNLKVNDDKTTEGETIDFCEGQEITFKITSDYDVTTYDWSFPTGWTIKSGEDTEEVVVTASATSGTVSATIANDCGVSDTRTIEANVTAKPATPGTITGAASVCKGTPQTYTVAAVDGATGYEWILPTGWTGTCDPEGGNTITATPGADAESGTIKVKATNDCGSSEYNTGISVTVGGYSIAISGVGAKSAAATYPWEYMTLTAETEAENITWNCVYSGTVAADLTVFETNGKTAKLKSGADASETEHYTVTASSTDGSCQTTSPGYDVYINAADIEICD